MWARRAAQADENEGTMKMSLGELWTFAILRTLWTLACYAMLVVGMYQWQGEWAVLAALGAILLLRQAEKLPRENESGD